MADQPPPAEPTPPDPNAAPPAAPVAAAPPTNPQPAAATAPATPEASAAPAPPATPTPADAPAPIAAQAPAAAPAAAIAPTSAIPEPQAADAGGDDPVSQESIDALLKQANFDGPESMDGGDGSKNPSIDQLLQQANFEDGAAVASELPGADAEAFKLPSFQQVMADAQVSSIDLLRDVELNVKIELGRSRMLVEEVLKLAEGSVVELDKLAGDPVDVFVNERLVARGEVLVLNDNFCVRVNEIVAAVKEEGP
jgi:flagellar motor switch protein FliN/FliY